MASTDGTRPRPTALAAFRLRAGHMLALARSVPLALAILLLAAIALRVALWIAYQPAAVNLADTIRYIDMARGELFQLGSPHPAGYPIFLRAVHAISGELELTIALQHLMGLATGLLGYAIVRRVGAPRWAALVAAAAVLLPLDQVFLEHALMTEALFGLLIACALYACVRSLDEPRLLAGPFTTRHAWILAAGVALGLSAWVRTVGVPLVVFGALWLALALPGPVRDRIGRAALAGGVGAAVLLVYFSLNAASTGYFGLTKFTGWALYSRTGQFADCTKFEPPPGTSGLCETTPSEQRPGPDFYTWEPQSPARQLYGGPPNGEEQLAAFGRAAILHQPFAYAEAVLEDLSLYFFPGTSRPYGGPGYNVLDVGRRAPGVEEDIEGAIVSYYPAEEPDIDAGGVGFLSGLQDVVRVHPTMLLVAVILGGVGLWLSETKVRAALALLLGTGLLLLVVPSATLAYGARYAVAASGPLIAAGALGLWLIVRELRPSSPRGPAP